MQAREFTYALSQALRPLTQQVNRLALAVEALEGLVPKEGGDGTPTEDR